MTTFWSSGKLLLCGEYWVLHGATALAVPTRLGQSLEFTESDQPLNWMALDNSGTPWLNAPAESDPHVSALLSAARALGGTVPASGRVQTRLEFDRNWGWGSSSSLTDLVAQWTKVDAMKLHFATSSGSGFDVACARASAAIAYQKIEPDAGHWLPVPADHWPTDHFALVYLGAKQNSQREVSKARRTPHPEELQAMSSLCLNLGRADTVEGWCAHLEEAEARTAAWIEAPRVRDRFPGVRATVKSLGAWGGDFALAVAQDPEDLTYFSRCGFLCLKWSDCVPPLP